MAVTPRSPRSVCATLVLSPLLWSAVSAWAFATAATAATASTSPSFAPPSAGLPALGEAATDALSGASERRLGQAIYRELLRSGLVHDDPEAQDYLQTQAARLLSAALARGELGADAGLFPEDFRFFLVKDPSINAFALPGGYIGVHSGLVVQSARESELMSVLAHEIGHVTQRHIARLFGQQRQSTGVMIAAALLAAIAASASPDAAMGIVSLGQTVAVKDQLSFSRDAEREADRLGLLLLEESGFAPEAMAELFLKLAQSGRYYESAAPSWLRSHPLTLERIADVQSRLQSRPRAAEQSLTLVTESLEFSWIRQRLEATGTASVDGLARLSRLLAARRADPAFTSLADQARIAYGQAWVALGQGDTVAVRSFVESSRQAALQADRAASGSPRREGQPPSPTALTVLAEPFWAVVLAHASYRDDQPAQALAVVEQALASRPQSVSTRALVRLAATAELALGRPVAALARARWLTTHWPQDPQAWDLQARAASAADRVTEAHAAQAERYWLEGGLSAALEQFGLARKASTTSASGDFVSLSQIDTKITQLRQELLRLKEEARQP